MVWLSILLLAGAAAVVLAQPDQLLLPRSLSSIQDEDDWLGSWRSRELQMNSMHKKDESTDTDIIISSGAQPCQHLSKELIAKHAKNNLVLLMAVDKLLMRRFGRTWIHNVKQAGITYWFIAALDPWTSQALGSLGVTQCFNAPLNKLGYKGEGTGYQWGSHHWHQTTWNKVFIVRTIYEMGFHVLHSDSDTTWFNDPLPWLQTYMQPGPPHALFSTDSLETQNRDGDMKTEKGTSPWFNINTGVYFVKNFEHGNEFFKVWLGWHPKNIGHDQDGLNNVVRGHARSGDPALPNANWEPHNRIIWCAMHNKTAVSFLPVHMFGNAYTYINGRVHEKLNATLYEIHWVWTGGSPECKLQNMRDAGRFLDPLEYYGVPVPAPQVATSSSKGQTGDKLMLLTMDLDRPVAPEDFNRRRFDQTETMIQFHVASGSWQLQQAYYGIMAAAVLDRTFVLPGYHCFCAKNWYMTQMCRINGEPHTTFPFMCSLSDLMRAKKTLAGIKIKLAADKQLDVHVREWPFLTRPQVPDSIKKSRLVVVPADQPRAANDATPVAASAAQVTKNADGGAQVIVPWPLSTEELKAVLAPLSSYRVVHLANATKLLGRGFTDPTHWDAYDNQIVAYKTYWCCRSPADQKRYNGSAKIDFEMLPEGRRKAQSLSLRKDPKA